MRNFLLITIATTLLTTLFGVYSWQQATGSGFDRVGTMILSAAGGVGVGIIIATITKILDWVFPGKASSADR